MPTKLELGAGYLIFTNAQGETWKMELSGVSNPEITASLDEACVVDANGAPVASIPNRMVFGFSCNANEITLEKNVEYTVSYAPTETPSNYSEEDIRELIVGEQE